MAYIQIIWVLVGNDTMTVKVDTRKSRDRVGRRSGDINDKKEKQQ